MINNNSFDMSNTGNRNILEDASDQLMEIREQHEDTHAEGFHQEAVSRSRASLDKVPNYAKPLQGNYPTSTKGAGTSHTLEQNRQSKVSNVKPPMRPQSSKIGEARRHANHRLNSRLS